KVVRSATQGKGLVATLLNNQQLADDLHALISNLRAHGVLFYRDTAASAQTKPPVQPKPARQARGRRARGSVGVFLKPYSCPNEMTADDFRKITLSCQ